MSLSFADEDSGPHEPSDHPPRHLAAGIGVAAAVAVMLFSLATLLIGGEPTSPSRSGSAVGGFAADFSLRDSHDERTSLSQYRGRPVLLLISRSPLAPEELGQLASLDSDLVVLNVHQSDLPAAGSQGRVVYLLDRHGAVSEDYELTRLPAALVISPDGLIMESGTLPQTLDWLLDPR